MNVAMQLIRALIVACALVPASANAQYQHLVGQWKTHLHQVGDVVLEITNVRPNGYVEGSYSNLMNASRITFSDQVDRERRTGTASVDQEGVLRMDSPGGRRFELRYVNGQLVGTTPTRWGIWSITFRKVGNSGSLSPRRIRLSQDALHANVLF